MRRMATPAKRPSSPSAKRAPAPASKPFLRFYHSEALRKKTLALLGTIEQAPDVTKHRDALGNLVVELTNCGLDQYFMEPLKLAKPGFMIEQSANLGMLGAQQLMASVIHQIIGRMDGPQLLSVCGSIRQFMH